MRPTGILGILANAVAVGLLITLMTGEARVVSLEVWLATALVWAMLLAGRALGRRLPGAQAPALAMVRLGAPERDPSPMRPAPLRSLDQLLRQSIVERRSYAAQLRPRLARLVANSADVPPDLQWMLEARVARAPELPEIERFIDAVAPASPQRAFEPPS